MSKAWNIFSFSSRASSKCSCTFWMIHSSNSGNDMNESLSTSTLQQNKYTIVYVNLELFPVLQHNWREEWLTVTIYIRNYIRRQWRVQGFPDGSANPEGRSANLLFGTIFSKNWMKMNKLDWERCASFVPPRFATGGKPVQWRSHTYCLTSTHI